jgi:hypothetical protein
VGNSIVNKSQIERLKKYFEDAEIEVPATSEQLDDVMSRLFSIIPKAKSSTYLSFSDFYSSRVDSRYTCKRFLWEEMSPFQELSKIDFEIFLNNKTWDVLLDLKGYVIYTVVSGKFRPFELQGLDLIALPRNSNLFAVITTHESAFGPYILKHPRYKDRTKGDRGGEIV